MSLLPENYSLPELQEYIRTSLGGLVWRLEGFSKDQSSQLDMAISEALHAYSRRCPRVLWERLNTSSTRTAYPLATTGIYGVWRVEFVYPSLVVSPFMSSLVGVSPVINLEGQDFNMFLHWRKTFQRVTGIEPKWMWDEEENMLRIHNPVHNAIAGVFMYAPRDFTKIKLVHKDWVRRASLNRAKEKLGLVRRKFGDSLPGPTGTGGLQLDGDKLVQEASAEWKDLSEELFRFQSKVPPMFD